MSFFRPTSESFSSAVPAEAGVRRTSEILGEAIMDSVSSVRDSLPEQHRAHFETLRQEIITFTEVHGIPRESLGKPDLLREVTGKLSTQDLERLALLLERFEYLLKNGEPKKEEIDPAKAIEYGEKFYHLREQYDSQVELLEEVGILKEGVILGIDGHEYPVPTLEQIASRLFERRETLKTKHDQGFTKLLLVPFGMSLDALQETIKQFFIKYKKSHSFDLDTSMPLFTSGDYQGADTGDSPNLFYYPQSFDEKGHQGKTKMEILREQEDNQDSFPGWTVHLFQPSNSDSQDTEAPMGFAHIPRQGKGTSQGDLVPRPSLEASKTPNEYLSILQNAQDDKDSPYHGETGMTPEDWITAFMIHLSETGKPLDDYLNGIESASNLTGAFFLFSYLVPRARWSRGSRRIHLFGNSLLGWVVDTGVRSSVML
ncbi:MAG: hypothetical protein UX57_C0010G0042 [Candidatus Uhrbacteria bacterium GW2011_GWE2_46_68]|uniref:Uncharacterized protein n=2 Tax=Candidatus Uhriibacteriota TaxID=1752732 RepID=A0A0G1SFD6_9BACT|nr:MAG: hypothetical protein UX45_C0012G0041 [Candidatus Uhrbacteria bacterium GW2011_GWF2_46_218]KKU40798.1 MAG: hypothetical protein UX57_C0010G0042 [Candidatus Uhrbacteria bacterium GW2011_GWE2_46_68]